LDFRSGGSSTALAACNACQARLRDLLLPRLGGGRVHDAVEIERQ
jgi:hypothetical protein